MAARYDVAARLVEGREAVAHTATYVAACRRAGYQHPELTGYDGQILDWYDGEDGLDLRLLDDDCAALRSAVAAAEEALRVQREQIGELAGAWRGAGAGAAAAFLGRHCDAGSTLVTGLRAAVQACEQLRDELWRCVDTRVATAVDVDDRVGAQRPVWLAAAHAGDVEVIEQQIKPYVDNEIAGEWLGAMRSARTGVAAAYDSAAMVAGPLAGVVFSIPGELGPRWEPDDPVAAMPAVPVGPAGFGEMPFAAPVDAPVDPQPAPQPAAPPAPLADPLAETGGWPADTGLPGGGLPGGGLPDFGLPGGGLPGGGGGQGGLIPRLADALGGSGAPDGDGFADPSADEPPGADEAADVHEEEAPDVDDDDSAVDDAEPEPAEVEEPAVQAGTDAPAEGIVGMPADQPGEPGQPEPASSTDVPEKTPCEMAADELPQAGQ